MLSWSLIQSSDHDCLHAPCTLLISSRYCLIHNCQSSWYLSCCIKVSQLLYWSFSAAVLKFLSCCIEVSQLSLKQLLLIQLLSIQLRRVSVGSLLPNRSCNNCTALRSLESLMENWAWSAQTHWLGFCRRCEVNRQIHVDRRCVNLLEQWEQMIVAWSCLVTIITW